MKRRDRPASGKTVDVCASIEEDLGGLESAQGAGPCKRRVARRPRLVVDLDFAVFVDVVAGRVKA